MLSPEAITAYMDAAQAHEDAEELVNLAKGILARMSASAAGSGSAARGARDGGAPQTGRRTRGRQDDELQEIRKTWGNPAHRILALQYIIQMGEREGHPEENLQDLRDELEDLELEHGDALRADLNTIGTASEDARSKEDVEAFQRTYRDVVLGKTRWRKPSIWRWSALATAILPAVSSASSRRWDKTWPRPVPRAIRRGCKAWCKTSTT